MKKYNITWLKLGDVVKVNNRLYEVVLHKWSNGSKEGYTAGLNLLDEERIINHFLSHEGKEKIKVKISDVELNKEDLPVKEEEIKYKDILKDLKGGNK